MTPLITIKACNRPMYLLQVLDKLSDLDEISNYDILISCDSVDKSMREQIRQAIIWSDIGDMTKVKMAFHVGNPLGCSKHTEYCLYETFNSGYDYAIHLEDDTLPSRDILNYFNDVAKILDENDYFAACTFHRPCHETETPQRGKKLVAKKLFDPSGGFAMTYKSWSRIQEMGGMFAVDYVSQKGRTHDCQGEEWLGEIHKTDFGGFGYPFDHYFREGKYCIFPKVSVVKNIGSVGQHLHDPEVHKKLQYNDNWFDKIYCYDTEYDTKNIEIDDRKFVEDGIEK